MVKILDRLEGMKTLKKIQNTYFREDKKKKFYIIRRETPHVGIFSCILTFLSHLKYADEKGYIPLIDMKYFDNAYLYKNQIGKLNAWDYYFLQPGNHEYTLEYVYRSKNVFLSTGDFKSNYKPSKEFLENMEAMDSGQWRYLWEKYIIPNEKTSCHIEKVYNNMFSNTDRVMGVLLRGSDYYHYYPKYQGEINEDKIDSVIKIVSNSLEKNNCSKLFLMTEDINILMKFQSKFGKMLFYLEDERVPSNCTKPLGDIWREKGIDLYQKGLNYITAFYVITKCCCFIGTKTSASVFFPIVGYKEWQYYFNLKDIE